MKTGVYPCYENQFQIGTGADAMATIADCESFSVSIDNGVEEWKPFDQEGWTRRLMTAKSLTISVTAKRNVGDAGKGNHRSLQCFGYERVQSQLWHQLSKDW